MGVWIEDEELEKLDLRAAVPLQNSNNFLLVPSFMSRSKTEYPVITPKWR